MGTNFKFQDAVLEIGKGVENFQAMFESDKANRTMSEKMFNYLTSVNLFYYDFTDKNQRSVLGDQPVDCGLVPVLVEYVDILTNNGNSLPNQKYDLQCYEVTMNVCWNYSDLSPKFCNQLCENGFVSTMLFIMRKYQHNFTKEPVTRFAVRSASGVLHNCSKINQNKVYFFNEPGMVDVLAWYAKFSSRKLASASYAEHIPIVSAITLAEVIEEKDNDVILTDNKIIRTILELLGDCMENKDHRAQEFSAAELLHGLTRLANNKNNSVIIVDNGILVYIRLLLNEGDETEQIAATEALWILAFSDKNKKKILADNMVMTGLKAASDLPETKSRKLKLNATWALWVLNQLDDSSSNQKDHTKQSTSATSLMVNKETLGTPLGHVMISYQWDCQQLMLKVKNLLEAKGYKVWMDLEEMRGSTLQAMARAVENSAVILISMSRKYKDSKSCRTEAEYAYQRDVPVIPLKVEDKYVPDGWLGAIVGAKLYYNITNHSNFDSVMSSLIKDIGNKGKKVQSSNFTAVDAPPLHAKKPSGSNFLSVKEWTKSFVDSWAQSKNITTLNTEFLDGEVLLFLKTMQRDAPEYFYRCATDQLGLTNIREVMKFSKAIQELH